MMTPEERRLQWKIDNERAGMRAYLGIDEHGQDVQPDADRANERVRRASEPSRTRRTT